MSSAACPWRGPDSCTGRSRCQPGNLRTVYELLEDKQIRAIKKAKLGNTLKIQFQESLPAALINYLVPKVNIVDNTLVLGTSEKPITINLFSGAKKVFGVKSTGSTIEVEGRFRGGKRASKRKKNLGTSCKVLKNYKNKLTECRNLRKRTCKIYMYLVLGWLLAPSTATEIDLRFMDIVEKVDEIERWNLTDLIVKLLVKGISDLRDGSARYLVGSPFLLIVIFLDMIDHPALDMPQDDFPRMQHIQDKHLIWINSMKGKWDTLKIKPVSDSCYRENLVYNMEDNYDLGDDCDDHFDQEKDDDLGHIDDNTTGASLIEDSSKENDEVDAHKGGESSQASLFRKQSEEAACLGKRYKQACDYYDAKELTIPKDVEEFIEKCTPDLPSDSSSSFREALTTYLQSENNKSRNNLKPVVNSIVKFCGLVQSVNKDLLNRVGQADNKKKKDNEVTATYEYPAADSYKDCRLTLFCADLMSLSGSISDRIMELYTRHLQGIFPSFGLESEIHGQYCITNTFFWEKIEDNEFITLQTWMTTALRDNSLTTDVMKYLLIPVHEDDHWSLAIIYRPQCVASTTTTIFHMDSVTGKHNADWVFNLAESFATNVLNIDHGQITTALQVPQQGDTVDCGFFTLYNMKRIITDACDVLLLEQICTDWYEPKAASLLREETIKMIWLYKMKYNKPVPECSTCMGKHESLVERFKDAFSS